MNGTMLNESMTDTTAKENSGVLDMNNMAFYYHALPPVDDILRSWVNGASTEKSYLIGTNQALTFCCR